jgi:hypothetical protein
MSMPEGFEQVDLGGVFIGTSNTELEYRTRQMNLQDVENMLQDLDISEARVLFRRLTPSGLYRDLDDRKQVIRMSITDVFKDLNGYNVSMSYLITEGDEVLQFRVEDLEGGGLDTEVRSITVGDNTMIINYFIPA